jgi:putative ABC transport system permease protein
MSGILGDVRRTFRQIGRTPGFYAVIVLTLALGIGADTALFSVVETVLLDPLPYPGADRLVTLAEHPWAPSEITLDLERAGTAFEEVAAYYPQPFAVTGGETPYEVEGAQVTPDFFHLLRARMALGRGFTAEDGRAGAPPTVVLSYGLWRRRYGGSPEVLGRTLRIRGGPRQVVGVLERGFRQLMPRSHDPGVWVPFEIRPTLPDGSMSYTIPLARLAPGVPMARAQAELAAAARRFEERHPERDRPHSTPRWARVKAELVHGVRRALLVLQLAVALVLLIASVNVANLLLARYGARRRELAVRTALGASKGRLVRELLTESLVLALLGGLGGGALAFGGLHLILALAPRGIPRLDQVSVNASVLLFTLGTSLATGLLFGMIPALATTRRSLRSVLKDGGGPGPGGAGGRHRVSQALVVTEVTLTLVLVIGAGLLVRTFVSLTGQAPGFRTEGVLAVPLHVPPDRYRSVPELEAFYARLVERLGRVPGIASVALTNNLPIDRGHATRDYYVEGEPETEDRARNAQYAVVSPDYFRVLGIPLLRGRAFTEADRRGSRPVAIIDQALWSRVLPGRDPIGRRIRFVDEDFWMTVVGVAGDIRGGGLAREPGPGFYIPYQQRPATSTELAVGRNVDLLALAREDGSDLGEALREAIWDVDPLQPVPEMESLASAVARGASPERFRAALLGTFAGLALLLVVAGVYGLLERLVVERTRELGIRRALGATEAHVVRSVLAWGLRLAAVGIALGTALGLLAGRLLAGLLFGVEPADPWTFAAAIGAVLLVTLAACLVPVRRAVRVDPAVALSTDGA